MGEVEEIGSVVQKMFPDDTRAEQVGEDYYGEDGLLYCGKCRTKKETRLMVPVVFGDSNAPKREKIVPSVCRCRVEEKKRREEEEKHRQEMRYIESLRQSSLIESKFRDADFSTFMTTKDNQKVYELVKRYVERFSQMYEKNQGLLFWGEVGTGKSYTAACIANELLQRKTTVIMTSFVKILQDFQGMQMEESQYIAKLNTAKLLIIDDLGTERNTDYALEKVYNVIDSRYRSGKPLILTTNMTLREMQETPDIRYKRIYDRIFEMCYPQRMVGKSWREAAAAKRFDEMRSLMEE